MIQTTYSLQETVFIYDGSIKPATVRGVIIAPDTEDYLVEASGSHALQRVALSQLFSSIDKLADKIVAARQAEFEASIQAIKNDVAKALADFNGQEQEPPQIEG